MNNIFFFLLCVIILSSCKSNAEYEENLENFKNLIEDINNYFLDSTLENIDISSYYTEDFLFHSYPVNYRKGVETSKINYINSFNEMKEKGMSINICHSIYLPGIDENSYEMNGSVRVYYGAILSLDTNNIEFSGYQTVNFEQGKISEIWEWADYGGVSLQLKNFTE